MYTRATYSKYSVGIIQLLYFLLYAAFAAWSSYFYVFLENERHLTGVQIGSIAAVQQINNIIFLPLWGMISDKYGKRKVFLLLLGISVFTLFGFLAQGGFIYYLVFIVFFSALHNPIGSLIDSFALRKANEPLVQTTYGKMRLWASVGWAVSSVGTGYLIKYTTISYIFPIASTILAITWIISFFLLNKKRETTHNIKPGFKTLYSFLIHNKQLLWFFLFIMLYYIFNSPTLMFINLYYNEIGASNSHIGLAFAVQSVFELPFMFFGYKIIAKYGIRNIILFTMFVAAVRMVLYGLTSNPWVAIAIGCTHGITLGLFLIAAIEYTQRLVPTSFKSTGQTLFYTFLGLGTSVGNILNGYLKDFMSLQHAMKLNAAMVLLLIIITICIRKKIQNS